MTLYVSRLFIVDVYAENIGSTDISIDINEQIALVSPTGMDLVVQFYIDKLQMFVIQMFVPGKPFQHILVFVGKSSLQILYEAGKVCQGGQML